MHVNWIISVFELIYMNEYGADFVLECFLELEILENSRQCYNY